MMNTLTQKIEQNTEIGRIADLIEKIQTSSMEKSINYKKWDNNSLIWIWTY